MYGYDEGGRRVAKVQASGGTTTLTFYPFAHYEQRGSSSSGVTKYYFFGGERFALRTGAGVTNSLRLLYKDRISSTVHATDQNGNFLGSTGYYAFGATHYITGTMPTDHRFTDQPLDGTGLYYYGARYYDPLLGQFISPDTLVPDPTNIMDYNRYAYARGNPLKYNDPTGHCVLSTVAGPAGLVVDVPCWSSGAGEAAVAVAGAGLVAGAVSVPIIMWVLDDPGPNYPAPETAGDLDTAGETFPYPSSTTVTIPIPGIQMNTEADTVVPGEVVYDPSETAILADPIPTIGFLPVVYASTQIGWQLGEPITNLTAKGNIPAWSTVRARYWKNEAYSHPNRYNESNLARMQQGLAPQRVNPVTGELESMELHHMIPQREGGLFDVIPVWPDEHGDIDPYRHP